MNKTVTIEKLKKVAALKELPDEHLGWILNRAVIEEYHDGDTIIKTGEPIDEMIFFLEGRMNFYMNINGKLVYYHSVENDEVTGGVSGLLPYSRLKNSPGNAYAVEKVLVLRLHKKYFKELEQLNPAFIQRLIGYMTERARSFATTQMQQEKVSALGRLAAGIAHEMNNPASAIDRISEELNKRWTNNFLLTEALLTSKVTPEIIKRIHRTANRKVTSEIIITALQRIQKEDEMNDWLLEKGINYTNEAAETLTDAGFSVEDLDETIGSTDKETFQNILNWLENLLSSERLIKDLESASERITMLVDAIKSHVQMDRAGDLYKTDIHKDIEDTLILLGYKIRDKNIRIKKLFCRDLPEVEVYIGELNQVWTNIIDNAIYAVPRDGEIIIETECSEKNLTVRITDNGAGVPKEIFSRIFDPFFTTKKVGEGTGIGLDIVKNVINHHNGEIKVNSIPGKTEFIICIPVTQQISEEIKDETSIHNNN